MTTTNPPRSRTRCASCRRPTHTHHDHCRDCRSDIPLRGGRWVLSPRRVLIWEPTKTRTTEETR